MIHNIDNVGTLTAHDKNLLGDVVPTKVKITVKAMINSCEKGNTHGICAITPAWREKNNAKRLVVRRRKVSETTMIRGI